MRATALKVKRLLMFSSVVLCVVVFCISHQVTVEKVCVTDEAASTR